MTVRSKPIRSLSLTLLVLGTFGAGVSSTVFAHEGEDHAATSTASAAAPATAQGILQAIDAKSAELQHTIQSGSLANVHHLAYAIRDLAASLPSHSSSLPADKLTAVKGEVKFVATLAERLDASGDANDKAASQANFDKLAKVLSTIKSNYGK